MPRPGGILSLESLAPIFRNMRATPDLSRVAEALGLSALTVIPRDAQEKGIISAVMRVVLRRNLTIREIRNRPLLLRRAEARCHHRWEHTGGLFEDIRALPQVKQIII